MSDYWTENEVARKIHVSGKTLQRFRQEGSGPKFIKAGRRVLYTPDDINSWLQAHRFCSTSEAKGDVQ